MSGPRLLLLSAAAPTEVGGPPTVTRGLIHMLEAPPLCARVECLSTPLPRSRAAHRWRQAAAIARSLTGPLPAKVAFRYSSDLREKARAADCDAVVFNGVEMLALLPDVAASLPRVLVAHNIEHELFAAGVGRLARRESAKLARWEIEGMHAVDRVVFLSLADAQRARGWVREGCVVPPVFCGAADREMPASAARLNIGWLGNVHWWPNAEGLRWFRENVLPHVRDRVCVHVFGPGSQALGDGETLVGHGPIADLARVWSSCDLTIAPLLHGSGVSVKVAEALFHGVPLLATSCAVRGLDLPADPCIAVTNDAAVWVEFLRDRAPDWRGQSVAARVRDRFAPETHAVRLQRFVMGQEDRLP